MLYFWNPSALSPSHSLVLFCLGFLMLNLWNSLADSRFCRCYWFVIYSACSWPFSSNFSPTLHSWWLACAMLAFFLFYSLVSGVDFGYSIAWNLKFNLKINILVNLERARYFFLYFVSETKLGHVSSLKSTRCSLFNLLLVDVVNLLLKFLPFLWSYNDLILVSQISGCIYQ